MNYESLKQNKFLKRSARIIPYFKIKIKFLKPLYHYIYKIINNKEF